MVLAKVDLMENSLAELEQARNKIENINELSRKDKRELIETLLLVIQDVKMSDPVFKVRFNIASNNHHETYLNIADKWLNKLYSDLEEIANRLRMDKMDEKSVKLCIRMLEKMIESHLNMDYIQDYIDKTSLMQEGSYDIGELRLSDRLPGEYPCDLDQAEEDEE